MSELCAETNLSRTSSGKIKLGDQSQIIRDTIKLSLPFLHASIILEHAFPDALLTVTFIKRALLAGISHNPNTTYLRHRILNDHLYLAQMCKLVRHTSTSLERSC